MKPGREFDLVIAREVMGDAFGTELKEYSTDVAAAFDVARKMGVTLIPVEGGQWFAFVGPNSGWKDPGEFLQHLSQAEFSRSGAAIADHPAFSICVAAYNAVKQRELQAQGVVTSEPEMGLTH